MSASPEKGSIGLVTFKVFSNGEQINDTYEVVSIWVRKEVNRIGKAVLVFTAGDMPKQEIPESDAETFAPGAEIRIEAGYQNSESIIFEGFVTSHNLDIPEREQATLQVECRDYAFPTTLNRKNRLFEASTDSDAISKILKDYSDLTPTVDATNTTYNELVQYYSSDWDFLLSRADANGLLVITEGKKITVKKPDLSASPVLSVTYGEDLIAFRGELQTAEQSPAIEAIAWDSVTQKLITATGAAPSLNAQGTDTTATLSEAVGSEKWTLQTESCPDKTALQSWADAQLLKAGMARIRGEIRFQGSSLAVPGCLITLVGLGKRFNGDAYIGFVEHQITEGEWVTTAGMGIDPQSVTEQPDVMTPAASGLLPGIEGLHIGKVTKLDEDPAKENRIQVEIPLLNSDKNTVWARLASFWASNKYGGFFIPDIDDEVVLGFLNNDPCNAVILGSMYSSKQTPSNTITAKNNLRTIFSKSGLKIELEEEKKDITITTPGKNSVLLSDDQKTIKLTDQHGNKVVMSDSGIVIDSIKDLTLKAASNVTIDGGVNVDAKAGNGLSLKGVNVQATADASFTAKGNASAEVSASGQTMIKGAMVMIN